VFVLINASLYIYPDPEIIRKKIEGIMRASWTPIAHTAQHRLGDSFVYDIARVIGSPFSFDLVGFENITTPGPAIYIANHLGALGAIETILSVPVRFYPWIIAEMTDFKFAPEYLFKDLVYPVLHLNGWFGMFFSTCLTKISVRLLRAIESVSIDRFGGLTPDGFRQSLRLLREGKNLLIFPEDPLLPLDPDTSMRHFMPGFATLCSLFQVDEGYFLPVHPMAVHAASETVTIGKPEFYHPHGQHREAINAFSQLVEKRVRALYLEMQKNCGDLLE
jgi:1-acyl-sn-glycerol-3-phosphate acyltransferase